MKIRSILIQYRILLYILSPMIVFITLIMAIRNKDRRYFFERFGFYNRDIPQNCMWFHAASVGEVNAVMPLIQFMNGNNPNQRIILSTGTPTGAVVAKLRLPENIAHVYLPLDFPGAVKRFIHHAKPNSSIIMETELWANLYYSCNTQNIPITIINARLSEKTLRTTAWMYKLYSETLSHVDKILARSDNDANGFITIGATSSKIKVVGNLKYAPIDVSNIKSLNDIKRSYILAASTHEGEEEALAKLWANNFSEHLLVIAPRHPNRKDSIIKSIRKYTNHLSIRSQNDAVTSDTQIYLADTIGELLNLISGSELVIMGGSFVQRGGHNIIEVAQFGKPLIFGRYMDNFLEEAELFVSQKAAIQVNNWDALTSSISDLLHNSAQQNILRNNSLEILEDWSDITQKYADMLNHPN